MVDALDGRVIATLHAALNAAELQDILALVASEASRCLGDIRGALARHDRAAAREAAHASTGMTRNFRVVRVASIASAIETACLTDALIDASLLSSLEMAIAEAEKALIPSLIPGDAPGRAHRACPRV